MQDARRNQSQNGLLAIDDQRVAGVVAALETNDAFNLLGQSVNDLAFSFIAPLSSNDDNISAKATL